MKYSVEIYGEKLAKLLEDNFLDDAALCNLISDYYSESGTTRFCGDTELYQMREQAKVKHKIYCTSSVWGGYKGVPLTAMIRLSNELNFETFVMATSYDSFDSIVKRLNTIITKINDPKPIKVFAIKNKSQRLSAEVVLQIIDWIENDKVPADWIENVKYKTIE